MTHIAKQDKLFLKKSGAYHTQLDSTIIESPGRFPLMQFKTKVKVNAKFISKGTGEDIVDEAITYFKANIFFRNYDMSQNEGDKLLVYLTFYISSLLLKFNGKTKSDCEKLAYSLAIENFALPGDGKFCLAGLVDPLRGTEKDNVRAYMTAIRHETGLRLVQEFLNKTI
ncbi:Actin-related protein 2/3 complex subunit 3 [Entamoeba marina]